MLTGSERLGSSKSRAVLRSTEDEWPVDEAIVGISERHEDPRAADPASVPRGRAAGPRAPWALGGINKSRVGARGRALIS